MKEVSENGHSAAKRQKVLEQRCVSDTTLEDSQNSSHVSTEKDEAVSEEQSSKLPEKCKENTAVESSTAPNLVDPQPKSSQPADSKWPWIRLVDNQGVPYFYNALTSKTAWTCDTDAATSEVEACHKLPPSAYSAATAQKAWQQFWAQCQEAQQSHASLRDTSDDKRLLNSSAVSNLSESAEASKTLGVSMAIYLEHYRSPTPKELGRAARQQVRPPSTDAPGYVQGFDEYNIWYGKYLSDRREGGRREDREKATTRCNPFTDSGWTRCDMEPELDRPVICLYFAKGCCYLGSNCRYYHRLPTVEDDRKLDMLHDIFGRERFAAHRDDMDGVGTFSEDCRTLFVGDLKVNRVYPNAEEKTEELIRQQFGLWGPLEDIRVIRNKNIAFVRYKYRVHAEFAKVAMAEQRLLLDRADDQISVRWAHPGRDASGDKTQSTRTAAEDWDTAQTALMKRFTALGYTQDDIECYLKWNIQHAELANLPARPNTNSSEHEEPVPVSQYPNTDARFLERLAHAAVPISGVNLVSPSEKGGMLLPAEGPIDESLTAEVVGRSQRLDEALSRIQAFSSDDVFKVDI